MPVSGGVTWVMVVNLIIWTGLFLYLRRLDSQVRALEAAELPDHPEAATTAPAGTPATPARKP